ncbi:MAG: aminoglycoside phosphotransferase family protein [Pseudomonadota bacterium]
MKNKLLHYCHVWDLRPRGKLTKDRPTSQLYKVDYRGRPAVLKLLTAIGMEDERYGATALAYWNGVGAARLYQADAGAHLLEFIDGKDCVALVREGRDDEALTIIGEVVANLNVACARSTPAALTTLEDRFSELFVAAMRTDADPIIRLGANVARELLGSPLNNTVLHGDLHHENVLHSSERGWLAIDAKGLLGETTYDGAMAILNPMGFDTLTEQPERIQKFTEVLADSMKVCDLRLLRYTFAHACLSASWAMETPIFSSSHALRIARTIKHMLCKRGRL